MGVGIVMSDQEEFKRNFDALKRISNEFRNNKSMGLDEIEEKFLDAKKAYNGCLSRVKEVRAIIESSEEQSEEPDH